MKYLLVIDMQEDYVGSQKNKKRYSYETKNLFQCINNRINECLNDLVIYITNKFNWEFSNTPKSLMLYQKIFMKKERIVVFLIKNYWIFCIKIM